MDALSEVLGHVRLKDASWACYVASSPWGVSLREAKGCVRFLYVMRGNCSEIQPLREVRGEPTGPQLAVAVWTMPVSPCCDSFSAFTVASGR
jgi:hypothetical protein